MTVLKTLIIKALRNACDDENTVLMHGVAETPDNISFEIKAVDGREFTTGEIQNALEELEEEGEVIYCGEGRYAVSNWLDALMWSEINGGPEDRDEILSGEPRPKFTFDRQRPLKRCSG
jgi:hypothetical protein